MVQVQTLAPTGRKLRNPEHSFHLRHTPWVIQPFLLAPVLPGETLKNLLMQSRCVTDPIKNSITGWWLEYYFFYVKHRDLAERDHLTSMMLTPNYSLAPIHSAAELDTYHGATGVNWAKLCLRRVVEEYFRDADEAWDAYKIGNLPIASINRQSWLDSVLNSGDMPDVDPNDTSAAALDPQYAYWEWMRSMKLVNMDYEDWLKSHGVRTPQAELHKPELIRYVRDWSYPTNTIDPSNGTARSAVSWAVAERADKDRFFTEPGFIFGVTVCRPKIYFGNQRGAGAAMLDDAMSWLPALMRDEPYTSLKKFADNAGPLPISSDTGGYWVDVRDLFLYGDQFLNFDVAAATDINKVSLPTATLQRRYALAADAAALFVGATAPTQLVRQDGVVRLSILGHQVDHT